jgi:hypothetical protein
MSENKQSLKILELAANHLGYELSELLSDSTDRKIGRNRSVIIYVLHVIRPILTWSEIADIIKIRSRSVVHQIVTTRMPDAISTDKGFKVEVRNCINHVTRELREHTRDYLARENHKKSTPHKMARSGYLRLGYYVKLK